MKTSLSVSSNISAASNSSCETDDEQVAALNLERTLFSAINNGDRDNLLVLLGAKEPDETIDADAVDRVLQLLLTTTYPNTDGLYCHDQEVLPDALELLGPSLEQLNAIQIACILGDEESALDILEFVSTQTEKIGARKVLYEFMGRVWGDGNTVLHLASFLGMSDLVKRLLELGANPNKKNGRLYKPVDCCDTDETRNVFSTVTELTRSNFNQPNYVTNSFGSLSSLNSISSKYIPDTSNSILTKRSSSLYWKEGVRSISQPSTPTSSQTFTLKKQNNLPNTPSRHQKTKSLDERILLVNLKDQLASFSGNMPLTSSLDSLTETKPQTNEESAPKRPKKTVSFSPDTILLDICQHGQEADETPLQTFQKTITLLPTTCDAANIISPQQNLTLLHLASAYGHLDIVQELLQRVEVQVNARDREGWTPLHCACAEGHLDVIKELCGAVGWITENGEKVSEVEEGDVTRMYWVVDGPIDVDAVNGDGETAEMVALEDKREEISLILKDARAVLGYELIPQSGGVGLEEEAEAVGLPSTTPLSPPESIKEPSLSRIYEEESIGTLSTQPLCTEPETSTSSLNAIPIVSIKLESSPSPPTTPKLSENESILSVEKKPDDITPRSSIISDQSLLLDNIDAEVEAEEPPKSPKPVRGTAARLIAAFNEKSWVSPSTASGRSSLSSPRPNNAYSEPSKNQRRSSLTTMPRTHSPQPSLSWKQFQQEQQTTTFIKSPLSKRNSVNSPSTATTNSINIKSDDSIVYSISVRRKSLQQQQILPPEQRRYISLKSSITRISETDAPTDSQESVKSEPSANHSSKLGTSTPLHMASASWSTLSPSKMEEKKKKAHRLSETTSGYLNSWMGLENQYGGTSSPLKHSLRTSVANGSGGIASSEQTLQ